MFGVWVPFHIFRLCGLCTAVGLREQDDLSSVIGVIVPFGVHEERFDVRGTFLECGRDFGNTRQEEPPGKQVKRESKSRTLIPILPRNWKPPQARIHDQSETMSACMMFG